MPRKLLAEKIQAWEFVEMAELLPEFWVPKPDEKESSQLVGSSRYRRPVAELRSWLQCFAIYAVVISSKHPEAVP